MDLDSYLRGRSAIELARALEIDVAQLSQWRRQWQGRRPSPQSCVAIERATGGEVKRWDLRPLDWHLIWPELIDSRGAPPVRVNGNGQQRAVA